MNSFDLIVLMISESGLRSSLAARLTIQGENVVTIGRGLEDPELDRLALERAVLIADEKLVDDRLARILADSGWHGVIVLNGEARCQPGDRLIRLERKKAVPQVIAALAEWRAANRTG